MILYLYGFVPDHSASPPGDLPGIDDRPVEMIGLGGYSAVVSEVAEEPYGDPRLSEQLKDVAWVGRRGLEHERVVTWFVDESGIVPARLFTLYSSRQSLESESAKRHDRIAELLARFSDLREWHLKISYDPERIDPHLGAESPAIQELDEAIATANPGRGYLLQRKRAELAREQSERVARRMADGFCDDVSDLVLEIRRLPVPDEATVTPVVLNAALLVNRATGDTLQGRVADHTTTLRSRGLDVAFSGPWAPYRFIPDERAAAADGGEA